LVRIVPAVAVNVVEVAPAGTVTEPAWTGSSALLLAGETSVPPLGAALLSVTVHVVAAPELKLFGLQASEDNTTGPIGAARLTVVVWDTPLRVAVSVAF
jgi:hypothetical protein